MQPLSLLETVLRARNPALVLQFKKGGENIFRDRGLVLVDVADPAARGQQREVEAVQARAGELEELQRRKLLLPAQARGHADGGDGGEALGGCGVEIDDGPRGVEHRFEIRAAFLGSFPNENERAQTFSRFCQSFR